MNIYLHNGREFYLNLVCDSLRFSASSFPPASRLSFALESASTRKAPSQTSLPAVHASTGERTSGCAHAAVPPTTNKSISAQRKRTQIHCNYYGSNFGLSPFHRRTAAPNAAVASRKCFFACATTTKLLTMTTIRTMIYVVVSIIHCVFFFFGSSALMLPHPMRMRFSLTLCAEQTRRMHERCGLFGARHRHR